MEAEKRIPTHVSIIMDGNGRWAKQRGMERYKGHFEGIGSVRAVTEAAVEDGIKYISLFAFSEENWSRPQAEIDALMGMMAKTIEGEYETLMKNGVRFVVLGNRARINPVLNAAIDGLMEATKNNQNTTMIVFLSYSGKWDILQAVKKIAKEVAEDPSKIDQVENMTLSDFDKYLVTEGIPDPDLLIRTSGEMRISNYLLWQIAYSEMVVVPTLWPDFRKDEFRAALAEYAKRDRRYGKVK